MQGQNSKTTFWGDLLDNVKETYRSLFETESYTPPAPVAIPVVKAASNPNSISLTSKKSEKKIIMVDLVNDAEEVLDSTPEDMQKEKELVRQNTVLAFQYCKSLNIDMSPNLQTNLVKTKNRKVPLSLQSQAYTKYQNKEKRATLQKFLSLIPIIGEIGANRILKGEWFRDNEVNHFLSLLTLRDKGLFHLDSLTASHRDFYQRLQSNPRYAKLAEGMRQSNRILFAVCKDKHWHLVIIDKQPDNKYAISCLDTLGYNDLEVANRAENILKALYADADNKPFVGKPRFITVPKQHNLLDCGVSVCYWANEIVKNQALPADQQGTCDYSKYRFEIADVFVRAYAGELRKPIVIEDEPVKKVESHSVNILDVWKRKHRM